MCGIAGILTDRGPEDFDVLRRMAAVLRHRGPDGYGLYRDDRVGLAHTRLSILDLAGGAQPIHNEDRTVWVVFNGEIFNHQELRNELELCGHRFYTRGDTEMIVHAFEEWGPDAWKRFNGQFAFALWDARERRLWLVRDRLGILPLYYAREAGRVIFASEAKALFASGYVPVQFDAQGIGQVFRLWAAPAPATVFTGILSIAPGTSVSFDSDLRETPSVYWRPDFSGSANQGPCSVEDAASQLGELLTKAIRLRLRADVPVGAYLSGGLDSSVIASLARSAEIGTLKTFAVRFEDPAFDETAEQRRMAALLGTEHHEIVCRDSDIRAALPDVIWQCETPLLRTGPVPLFLLSDLVRRSGMKVVLTGEGADELVAGYSIFKEDRIRRFWARCPQSTLRPALLARIHPYVADADQRASAMWREFYRHDLDRTDDPFYSHAIRWDNTGWATRFLAPHVRARIDQARMADSVASAMPDGWRGWRPLARAQIIEIVTFLSPYLLSSQGDRVAMGHGVEVRYPYLDPDVVEFCAALPDGMKLCGLRDKVALRALASRSLPADIWQRPKHPYRAPTTAALFAPGPDDYVRELLTAERLEEVGLLDTPVARRLVDKALRNQGRMAGEREEMALLGMLTLQILADQYQGGFSRRVADLVQRLDGCAADVHEDLSSAAPTAGAHRKETS